MRSYMADSDHLASKIQQPREREAGMRARWRVDGILLCLMLTFGPLTGHRAYADTLKPFTASYVWIWHGMTVAASTLELAEQDGRWIYRSRSEPRGIGRVFAERPKQESVLELTGSGIRPLSYKAEDGTSSTKRTVNLHYDWEHGGVTGVYENTKVDLPLRPGMHDDLSVQIALMVDLLQGRNPNRFLLIDRNSVREYHYIRENEETLDTAAGTIDTIVFKAQKQGSPRMTHFWCAPSLGYIPLRVEQRRGDDVEWSMQIRSVKRD